MAKRTEGLWEVRPYLRPDLDDDPMGVYVVEPVAGKLTEKYFSVCPDTDEEIAELDLVHDENRANAEFIATAVNCHDELVAALKNMIQEFRRKFNVRKDYSKMVAMVVAQKAIEKAEAKGGEE